MLVSKFIVSCERYSLRGEFTRDGDVRPTGGINTIGPKVSGRSGSEFPGSAQINDGVGDARDLFRQRNKDRPWPDCVGLSSFLSSSKADIRGQNTIRLGRDRLVP